MVHAPPAFIAAVKIAKIRVNLSPPTEEWAKEHAVSTVRQVQRKKELARQSGKGKEIYQKGMKGDWPLRRISSPPFWWIPLITYRQGSGSPEGE